MKLEVAASSKEAFTVWMRNTAERPLTRRCGIEDRHREMDELLYRTLIELGFEEGVQIFLDTKKCYGEVSRR